MNLKSDKHGHLENNQHMLIPAAINFIYLFFMFLSTIVCCKCCAGKSCLWLATHLFYAYVRRLIRYPTMLTCKMHRAMRTPYVIYRCSCMLFPQGAHLFCVQNGWKPRSPAFYSRSLLVNHLQNKLWPQNTLHILIIATYKLRSKCSFTRTQAVNVTEAVSVELYVSKTPVSWVIISYW